MTTKNEGIMIQMKRPGDIGWTNHTFVKDGWRALEIAARMRLEGLTVRCRRPFSVTSKGGN